MSPAETIAAAIEKLERLRDGATPGPRGFEDGWQPPQWSGTDLTYVRVVAGEPNDISGIRSMVLSTDGALPATVTKARTLADAELIVTLHRTIDSLLRILRDAIAGAKDLEAGATPDEPAATMAALELARAILGEVS